MPLDPGADTIGYRHLVDRPVFSLGEFHQSQTFKLWIFVALTTVVSKSTRPVTGPLEDT